MTFHLNFFVPSTVPMAEPRPRVALSGHVYTPPTADVWKSIVRAAAVRLIMGNPSVPNHSPFSFVVELIFPRPKSHWRGFAGQRILKKDAPKKWHTQKPDGDNVYKAAQDALGAWDLMPPLIWFDDSQVVRSGILKRWADPVESDLGFFGARFDIEQLPW